MHTKQLRRIPTWRLLGIRIQPLVSDHNHNGCVQRLNLACWACVEGFPQVRFKLLKRNVEKRCDIIIITVCELKTSDGKMALRPGRWRWGKGTYICDWSTGRSDMTSSPDLCPICSSTNRLSGNSSSDTVDSFLLHKGGELLGKVVPPQLFQPPHSTL